MSHLTTRIEMASTMEINDEIRDRKPGLGQRHVIVALLFLAYTSSLFSSSHISVAVVAMTSAETSNPDFPIFNWTETQKSAPLSSYYVGLMIGSISSGEMIRIFGASRVLFVSFLAHAALSAIATFVTWNGSWLLLSICRAITGMSHGFLDPLLFFISSRWFPPNERNFLMNFVFMGPPIGASLALQVCGFLAVGPTGWPSIFYFASVLLLLFCILWRIFGAVSPQECKTIRPEERAYIEHCLKNVKDKEKTGMTPWKSILTSTAVYAAILANVANSMLLMIMTNEIVLFIDSIQEISISMNGLLTSLPCLTSIIYLNIVGVSADLLLTKKLLTTIQLRKISATIGLALNATAIIGYGFIGSSLTATIVVLAVNYFALSFSYVGYVTNSLDLSPNHSQSIVGVSRAMENIASFFTPLIFSSLLTDKHNLSSWRIAFAITAAPAYFCYAFFMIFGRAEPQPWDSEEEIQ